MTSASPNPKGREHDGDPTRQKAVRIGPLESCTLTGADETAEPLDLFRLSIEFPFVEWGILYHEAKQGQGRYPSIKWITRLCRKMPEHPKARFALHICGRASVNDFLLDGGVVTEMANCFGRIQLNLTAANVNPDLLVKAIQRCPNKVIITQHNSTNHSLLSVLRETPNHAVLFDESGGQGISPAAWPLPLSGKKCGYAGGLGADNLVAELQQINGAAAGLRFWIDMEGKLRDERDQFDLAIARRCLEISQEYAL